MPSEDAKPMKKEEVEDNEDEISIGSLRQNAKKKVNNGTHPNGARARARARVKKEESTVKKEENNDDFEEPIVNRSLNKVKKEESEDEYGEPTVKKSSEKTDKKKKKMKEEEKRNGANGAKQNVKKREKKVYHLLGQKRDLPEERDPLRISMSLCISKSLTVKWQLSG